MKQRGRKQNIGVVSIDGSETIEITALERPEPPDDLTELEAEIWKLVTGTMPPEWFKDDSLEQLRQYCVSAVLARKYKEKADAFEENFACVDLDEVKVVEKFRNMRAKETAIMLQCARAMRITNLSRTSSHGTGNRLERKEQGDKSSKLWSHG